VPQQSDADHPRLPLPKRGSPDIGFDADAAFLNNALVRVISWNMGLNERKFQSPGLHDQAWHHLIGLGPDLAFLQETLPPAWVRCEGQLIAAPFKKWGSVIFSPRYPLQPIRLPDESQLRTLGAYVALGTASLEDGTEAFVASVHARSAAATEQQLGNLDPAAVARKSVPQPKVNDLIFFELKQLVGPRFLAAGDWNTGRTQSSARAGAEFFDRAHDSGWFEPVWDKFEKEERTWYGKGQGLVQDDHVFCDPALGELVHEAWAAGETASRLRLSDHAPLIVDFNVRSVAMTNLQDEPAPNASTE
jgi:hypothetical protein